MGMTTLKAAGLLDVDTGVITRPGILRVEGDRITQIGGPASGTGEVLDLGELILLPGLMDMEVNLLMGGRGETATLSGVQDDPPTRVLRAVGNARRTLRAGFTTVRNLGLFVKTGGYLLDVALGKAIDAGWIDGPRVVPAGHAITPTGGHLDPTMFAAFAPHVLEWRYESVVSQFDDHVTRLGQFLELADASPMARFAEHAQSKRFISTPSYAQVTQGINRKAIDRWHAYREQFEPILPLLRPLIERLGYTA